MMHILYRCCNKELEFPPTRKGRPHWFSKISCFNSLHNSYVNSRFKNDMKFTVLMQESKDGGDMPSSLYSFISDKGYEIVFHKGSSDLESKTNQIQYYQKNVQPFGHDVYMVEDDYLHTTDALDCIYLGVKRFGFVTGFDCMDRYTRDDDVTSGKDYIYFHEGKHWRTAESTTNTWAASNEMMVKILPYALHYGIYDRIMFRHMYFQDGIRIHQPMLGVSCHVHEGLMPPGVDWECVNEQNNSDKVG
jgi:hypothetical protein